MLFVNRGSNRNDTARTPRAPMSEFSTPGPIGNPASLPLDVVYE